MLARSPGWRFDTLSTSGPSATRRVAGETPDAHAVNRASADPRLKDARLSARASKFTLERYGSLSSTERAHLDREGEVPRRRGGG